MTKQARLTYWNRIVPIVDIPNIEQHLSARIRDPLWMLTRQWQLGEFWGEDAGSAAFVSVQAVTAPVPTCRIGVGNAKTVQPEVPLELAIERECFDIREPWMRVELGVAFEACLAAAGGEVLIDKLRAAYVLSPDGRIVGNDGKESYRPDPRDHDAQRFLRICGGRSLDAIVMLIAVGEGKVDPSKSPAEVLAMTAGERHQFEAALTAWMAALKDQYWLLDGKVGKGWQFDRLEYTGDVAARTPYQVKGKTEIADNPKYWDGIHHAGWVLSASPNRDGDLDWYSFDPKIELTDDPTETSRIHLGADSVGLTGDPETGVGAAKVTDFKVFPTHVRFKGMPNERWWDFESNQVDFGEIHPERRDLAKLLVMDFALAQSNDWFTIPLDMELGTICYINYLVVTDVFGNRTLVQQADNLSAASSERWRMFAQGKYEPNTGATAPAYFMLPWAAGSAVQYGTPIEEVRFLRDHVAEMVWGIEGTTPNAVGAPWSGYERAIAEAPGTAPGETRPPQTAEPKKPAEIPLHYLIETTVPENWIPLMPVSVDPGEDTYRVMLRRSAMERVSQTGPGIQYVQPLGRILGQMGESYTDVREEEVPREGLTLQRVVCRTRWLDGSTRMWITRKKTPGLGEGRSGLAYDLALTKATT